MNKNINGSLSDLQAGSSPKQAEAHHGWIKRICRRIIDWYLRSSRQGALPGIRIE